MRKKGNMDRVVTKYVGTRLKAFVGMNEKQED